MPFSSGVFQRVYNWVNDKNNSIDITASRMDTEMNGMATGLSTCILKDGTQTITANIPFSGFKITGLGDGAAVGDAANISQVQKGILSWVAGGGTADAITAAYSPAVTELTDGMELNFRASGANTVTNPTFSPNGLLAHTITLNGGDALSVGSIPGAEFEGKLRYNLANTRWELLNPAVTLPTAPFADDTAIIKGSADATKQIRFEVDGLTAATTRVWTAPDKDGTIAMTSDVAALLDSPALTGTPTAPTAGTNTSTTQLATCAFVNPSNSLSTNGYQKLPSGLIIQWGFRGAATTTSSDTISFPIAFPNALYSVTLTNFVSGGLAGGDAGYSNLVSSGLSSFTTQYTCNRYWMAIGK